ncbi:MAG: HAD family hydrolase [Thermoplasmata archaeon HGW-Thermoplasmata-1]|nr:MAG: HAD family hydrolase [Thermoplasmata archaeon HGW-Thermoplasmata-1]
MARLGDNDGVLVDTEHLYYKSTKEVLSEVGVLLSEEVYVERSLRAGRSLFDVLCDDGFSDEAVRKLRERRDALYAQYIENEDVAVSGMERVISKLHGSVKMGVVTSSKRGHFDAIHKKTGFMGYFDFSVVREDCVESKPSPEPYLKGVALSGFSASECLAVEDSERGLRSAVSAGIDCIVTPRNLSLGMDFTDARAICRNPDELLSFIKPLI